MKTTIIVLTMTFFLSGCQVHDPANEVWLKLMSQQLEDLRKELEMQREMCSGVKNESAKVSDETN